MREEMNPKKKKESYQPKLSLSNLYLFLLLDLSQSQTTKALYSITIATIGSGFSHQSHQ